MEKTQKNSKSAVGAVEARKGAAVGKKKKVIDLSKQGSQGRSPRVLTAAADIEKIDNVCVCANEEKTQNENKTNTNTVEQIIDCLMQAEFLLMHERGQKHKDLYLRVNNIRKEMEGVR